LDLGLTGKIALVTGGGSQIGIGKAIAITLAKEGCDIVVIDIDLEGAKQTAGEIKALGRKASAFKANIMSSAGNDGI
jgi:NAD(P)-dependent dehydrogenase (short-subunit alcohol dehydrogenase family)